MGLNAAKCQNDKLGKCGGVCGVRCTVAMLAVVRVMTLLNARRAYHGHINYSIKGVKKSLKYLCVTPLSK